MPDRGLDEYKCNFISLFPFFFYEFEVPAEIRSGNPEGSISREIGLSRVLLLTQYFYPNVVTQEDTQIKFI